MSKSQKGCHVRTKIPVSTYTFKWSIEHFSKLLLEKQITSPDFYPLRSGDKWYSTLKKSSSFATWIMYYPAEQKESVKYNISVVDNSGKLWLKKKLLKNYNTDSNESIQEVRTGNYKSSRSNHFFSETVAYSQLESHENTAHCVLIDDSDAINTTDLYHLTKYGVTFSCFMTFTGHDIDTQNFELRSEDLDARRSLEKLSNDLKTMYGVSLYTDICLRIGSESLRAHKAILCGRSPVFAKMFEHRLEERENNVVDIVDLDMHVLKDLISFLYTATIPNESFDSVLALYYAADKYDVEDLRQSCREILSSKLTIDNACSALALADRHSDHILKDSVMTFVNIHLVSIMGTEEWDKLVTMETKLAAEVLRKHSESKIDSGTEKENL